MNFKNNSSGISGLRQQMVKLSLNNRAQMQKGEERIMLSKVKASQDEASVFNYEKLQKIFQEEGVNALLSELKELRKTRIVSDVEVLTDSISGKTTIKCESDGIIYSFVGAAGDIPNEDSSKNVEEITNNVNGTSINSTSEDDSKANSASGIEEITGETDPHYPKGYTIDELNEEFNGIYNYSKVDNPNTIPELWREPYHKFVADSSGNNLYPDETGAGAANFLLDMLFVQINGLYYMRSDFTFDSKHYESLDDVKQLFMDTIFNPFTDPVRGKYYLYQNQGSAPTVMVNNNNIDNCGYDFLPSELDAYFTKTSNGQYVLKPFGYYQFCTFEDFVTYLKGGHTAAVLNHNLISKSTYTIIDPKNLRADGLMNEKEMQTRLEQIQHMFDGSKNNYNYLLKDINLSDLFLKTQHGEYVINSELVTKLFPEHSIKTFGDLYGVLVPLAEKTNMWTVEGAARGSHVANPPKVTQITEKEAAGLGFVPVKTAQELQQALSSNPNAKIILMADIDMSGINWTPIGTESIPFTGQLNGNGHTIKNLNITSDSYHTGMFGVTDGAFIYNLNLDNIKVNGKNTDKHSAEDESTAGLLVGYAKNTVFNTICVNNSNVTGNGSAGLIAGKINGGELLEIEAYNSNKVSGKDKVGGIAGNVVNVDGVNSVFCAVESYGGVWLGGVFGSVDNGIIGVKVRGGSAELLHPDETNLAHGTIFGRMSANVHFDTTYKNVDEIIGKVCELDYVTGQPYTAETGRNTDSNSSMEERIASLNIYKLGGVELQSHLYWEYDNEKRGHNGICYDMGNLLFSEEYDADGNRLYNSLKNELTIYNGMKVVLHPVDRKNTTTLIECGTLYGQVGADLVLKRMGIEFTKLFYSQNNCGEWSVKDGYSAGGFNTKYAAGCEHMFDEICKEFAVEIFGQEIVNQCFTLDKDGNYILKDGATLDGYEINSLTFLAMYVQMDAGVEGAHAGCANNQAYVEANKPSAASGANSSTFVDETQGINNSPRNNNTGIEPGLEYYSQAEGKTSAYMKIYGYARAYNGSTVGDIIDNAQTDEELEGWYMKEITFDENGNEVRRFVKVTLENRRSINGYFRLETDMSKYRDEWDYYVNADYPEVSQSGISIDTPYEIKHKVYEANKNGIDNLKDDLKSVKDQLKSKLSSYISESEFERVFEDFMKYSITCSIGQNYVCFEKALKKLIESLKNYKEVEAKLNATAGEVTIKENITIIDDDYERRIEVNSHPELNRIEDSTNYSTQFEIWVCYENKIFDTSIYNKETIIAKIFKELTDPQGQLRSVFSGFAKNLEDLGKSDYYCSCVCRVLAQLDFTKPIELKDVVQKMIQELKDGYLTYRLRDSYEDSWASRYCNIGYNSEYIIQDGPYGEPCTYESYYNHYAKFLEIYDI